MRPLLLGPEQMERIREVVAYAERERFTNAELLARPDCKLIAGEDLEEQAALDAALAEKNPDRPALGDDPGHCCVLPVGYRVVFTIEQQPEPLGWCRHTSISVDTPGKLPHEHAVALICKALGFARPLEENIVYIEANTAVNVIEPMSGFRVR